MYQPLDGPAVYGALSVTTTPVELKVGASPVSERKVISFQPTDGVVYYGYDSSVSSTTGTKIFSHQLIIIEASEQLAVYLVSETGTVNVRITEVS
jgi:hypothetical protein